MSESGFVWTRRKSWEVSATDREGNMQAHYLRNATSIDTRAGKGGNSRQKTEIQPLQEQSRSGLQCR